MNVKIVSKALQVIFEVQQKNGLWRRGQAIQGDDSRRDIGNSYVFSFDMIGTLLEEFESTPEMIQGYIPNLFQALKWAEDNYLSLEVQGELISGWRSNHLKPGAPQGWSSAQVLFSMSKMRKFLRKMVNNAVLEEF